jgi:hypothetical protein
VLYAREICCPATPSRPHGARGPIVCLEPEVLLGLVATVFIAAQLALILRLSLPSYFPWAVVAAVGAAVVLNYAILAEYFPEKLAGRANGTLNLFHIAAAFVVQYATAESPGPSPPQERLDSRKREPDPCRDLQKEIKSKGNNPATRSMSFKGFLLAEFWPEISLVEASWKRQEESRSVQSTWLGAT